MTGTCKHPTRGSYVAGCRCAGCTEKNARYIRDYRNRGGTSVYRETPLPRGDHMLDTLCWCGEHLRPIPAADVAAGRTWACGRDGCAAPTTSQQGGILAG